MAVANHLHGKLGSSIHRGGFIHSFEISPRLGGDMGLLLLLIDLSILLIVLSESSSDDLPRWASPGMSLETTEQQWTRVSKLF